MTWVRQVVLVSAILLLNALLGGCAGTFTRVPLPPVSAEEEAVVVQRARPIGPHELEAQLSRNYYAIAYEEGGGDYRESRDEFVARMLATEANSPTVLVALKPEDVLGIAPNPTMVESMQRTVRSAQAPLEKRLARVGARLASAASRPALTFELAPKLGVNAAAPFGFGTNRVLVGPGLILLLDDEDELAFALGHETAHIAQEHTRAGAIEEIVVGTLQIVSAFAVLAIDVSDRQQGGSGMTPQQLQESMAAATVTGLVAHGAVNATGFTRDEEREADYYGLQYAREAGYSVTGGAGAARKLLAYERGAGSSFEIPFLSEHPATAERVVRLEKWSQPSSSGAPTTSTSEPPPANVAPIPERPANITQPELPAGGSSCWTAAGAGGTLCTTCCDGGKCTTHCDEQRTEGHHDPSPASPTPRILSCWNVDGKDGDAPTVCTTCCSADVSCSTKCARVD